MLTEVQNATIQNYFTLFLIEAFQNQSISTDNVIVNAFTYVPASGWNWADGTPVRGMASYYNIVSITSNSNIFKHNINAISPFCQFYVPCFLIEHNL